ncbi:hypothetical protein EPN28_03005 [Patescibacteria group bacterium]|nr:MAG: hypothetical protein EPN28_03005 [Patescibacteria group bacterium]
MKETRVGSGEDVERDKRAEVLTRFLKFAREIAPFKGKKLEEIFANEEQKREFIKNLDIDGFIDLLSGVNGILRDRKKTDWSMDGKTVKLSSVLLGDAYVPPEQEDKPELLEKSLEGAQEMVELKRDIKDIALLLASCINAIHPFADGNGRTSRVIYLLTANDLNEDTIDKLKEALSQYGREKIDPNPGFVQYELDKLVDGEVGLDDLTRNPEGVSYMFASDEYIKGGSRSRIKNNQISEEDKILFHNFFYDHGKRRYFFLALLKFVLDKGLDVRKYIKKFGKRTNINADEVIEDIDQNGMDQIKQNYRNLKKRYVEILIDCMVHPEKEQYKVEHGGKVMSLKDYFQLKIQEEIENCKE